MILICYDGSPDAAAAVERAATLFPDQPATVLTVWEPFVEVATRTTIGFGLIPSIPDPDEIDDASRQAAEKTAGEGAKLATEHGLTAQARTCAQTMTIADALLVEAERIGADAIVMGSRGLSGVKSLQLGSVSHELIQHADRAVIVVPSPQVAAARHRGIRQEASS